VSATGGEGGFPARSDTCFTNAPPVHASYSERFTSQHTSLYRERGDHT
jgi:hypothetical protein